MRIYLGIVGDDLDPSDISAVLGGQPHQAGRRGDLITATTKGLPSRPAIAGHWSRNVEFSSLKSADAAVRELFVGLESDARVWRTLATQFRMGITVHRTPPGATAQVIFSSSILALFKERGLTVHLNED